MQIYLALLTNKLNGYLITLGERAQKEKFASKQNVFYSGSALDVMVKWKLKTCINIVFSILHIIQVAFTLLTSSNQLFE